MKLFQSFALTSILSYIKTNIIYLLFEKILDLYMLIFTDTLHVTELWLDEIGIKLTNIVQ